MANYGGMPSDVQNKTQKKKKVVETVLPVTPLTAAGAGMPTNIPVPGTVPVLNATTLNTPQLVQDAMAMAAATVQPVLPSPASLNTPIAVQNQMSKDAPTPTPSTPLTPAGAGMPTDIQRRMYPGSTSLNTPINVQDQMSKDAPTPTPSTPLTPAGAGMPTDIQNRMYPGSTSLNTPIDPNKPPPTGGLFKTPINTDKPLSPPPVETAPVETAPVTTSPDPVQKEQNPYYSTLLDMKFDYNPTTDQGYLQASAQAENGIIQGIIGRGGLYSSVARDAVAVKMGDLAIEYEKVAYDKFVSERAFTLTIAQFEQSRIDTAWEHNFAEDKFAAEQEQVKFTNALNLAEFKFAQDKEAFNQRQASAASGRANQSLALQKKAAAEQTKLNMKKQSLALQFNSNKNESDKLMEMKAQWLKSGTADKEVAKFFSAYGVQKGEEWTGETTDMIYEMENNIAEKANWLSSVATEVGEAQMAQDYMATYMQPAQAVTYGTTKENSNSDMQYNYQAQINSITNGDMPKETLSGYVKDIQTNYDTYVGQMGQAYTSELIDWLIAQKQKQPTLG